MKHRELGLIQGFFLCLRDSETLRQQTSPVEKKSLGVSSGVCLEIAALPFLSGLIGYETSWYGWLLTWLFSASRLLGLTRVSLATIVSSRSFWLSPNLICDCKILPRC